MTTTHKLPPQTSCDSLLDDFDYFNSAATTSASSGQGATDSNDSEEVVLEEEEEDVLANICILQEGFSQDEDSFHSSGMCRNLNHK